jgi:hypothetical protein
MPTIKIRQKTNYPDTTQGAGAVLDWDETEAKRMIAAGLVDEVLAPSPPAPTPRPKPETATRPKATEKRG